MTSVANAWPPWSITRSRAPACARVGPDRRIAMLSLHGGQRQWDGADIERDAEARSRFRAANIGPNRCHQSRTAPGLVFRHLEKAALVFARDKARPSPTSRRVHLTALFSIPSKVPLRLAPGHLASARSQGFACAKKASAVLSKRATICRSS